MKKILSLVLAALLLVAILPSPFGALAAGNTYKELSSYNGAAWQGNGVTVEAYKMTPSADNMAAMGFTVDKAGEYSFTAELMIDAESMPVGNIGKDAFGFIVLERRSNTLIYPSSKSEFYTIKNTEINQQTNTTVSGSFTAKAGDELVFIVKNELSKTCSLQILTEIKKDGAAVSNNYDNFSDTQGKNGWKYYSVSENGFSMPKMPAGAAAETTNGFVELGNFDENWWWVNKAGKSDTNSPFYGMAGRACGD